MERPTVDIIGGPLRIISLIVIALRSAEAVISCMVFINYSIPAEKMDSIVL